MVVIGTGVSVSLAPNVPELSWKGLVQSGFKYAVRKGRISPAHSERWKPQIDSNDDLDELLLAADYMGRKLDAPTGDLYARWMEEVFADVKPTHADMVRAVKLLHEADIPIITLNYDHLLEEVTGAPPITLTDTRRVMAFMRREEVGVLHLHGSFREPSTCVLGSIDYSLALASEVRDLLQRSVSTFGRLLFIGCGGTFMDPNFSRLIRWLRTNVGTAAPEHHALVKNDEVTRYEADPAWHGFVQPVGYGDKYEHLPAFLVQLFSAASTALKRPRRTSSPANPEHGEVLSAYRSFLIKDCGEMTIEGVRADMDTAQRRFDLEKLFVPLNLLAFPPELSERDPERERKLIQWKETHGGPRPFGVVFKLHKRLALLALPGGGKTMLLKRIAVAYSDPARRARSQDDLPDMSLMPVVIRCREWREHIHRPILGLLDHIHVITGRTELEGLRDALLPLFRDGHAMLLVDGLDEIHDDGTRTTFVNHLDEFVREFSDARVVVTSREAGFALVAPRIASFCDRYRIAPLPEETVHTLCTHWHVLMSGDSTTSRHEAQLIATKVLNNSALRRLAENPLLLTMLLVVKHGAGRIPPDRVSLYTRAVEVLLDTWNTQGHAPLNVKEAVPQLAFLAYEMMRAGKQTATEKEMLAYLEAARALPGISLYAKDRPHEFLKRVELRSSLLVEAGHQVDLGQVVPFFQFRHLTFQEYLAAMAVVDGHYAQYKGGDTVLAAIDRVIYDAKWKEVIPMVAVLAKKANGPLVNVLATDGQALIANVKARKSPVRWNQGRLPPVAELLVRCLVEETEFASRETLMSALEIVAFFAQGCLDTFDWVAVSTGPYGELLLRQAIALYMPMNWPRETLLITSCVRIAGWRHRMHEFPAREGAQSLERLLQRKPAKDVVEALFTCTGILWAGPRSPPIDLPDDHKAVIRSLVELHLFSSDQAISAAAAWTWAALERNESEPHVVPPRILDRLVSLWLGSEHHAVRKRGAIALTMVRQPRGAWCPELTASQKSEVAKWLRVSASRPYGPASAPEASAALIVAYHSGDLLSDHEIRHRLRHGSRHAGVAAIARHLRAAAAVVGRRYKVSSEQHEHSIPEAHEGTGAG